MEKEKIYKEKKSEKRVIPPGDPSGLPDDFFNAAVFIDNAYLIRLKNYFFNEKFNYSLRKFVENLAGRNNLFVKGIYLYDAPPFQSKEPDEKESGMKENYDRFVSFFKKENIIVREGRTQRLKVGNSYVYRQKGVDMLLGIDMVGAVNEFDDLKAVVLFSGDSDFVNKPCSDGNFIAVNISYCNISSNSLGENILTLDCFLSPLSPENIGQSNFSASAKYGESLEFNSIASGNLSMNSDEGIIATCFLIKKRVSLISLCDNWDTVSNFSIFLFNSDSINSGATNSNFPNNLFFSNTSKLLPLFINAENMTFTSKTNSIYSTFDLNNSLYLSEREALTSSDNFCTSFSVNLDFESPLFNLAIPSSSSFILFDISNCQFILLDNASSFNSSGIFIEISSIFDNRCKEYLNFLEAQNDK